ncbi:hypothetical protein ACUC2M_10785 [Bacillus cytotoxicus]
MDMASGCIVGECPICEDWMFEDEWIFDKYDNIVHERCLHSKGKKQQNDYSSAERNRKA